MSLFMCKCCENQFVFRFFFACWVWQMESGSKWHSYKVTPGGDGLVTATSVAIRTESVHVCMCARVHVCVSYGQHKCWHTMANVGDGAKLNSLWDAPKKAEKHISLKMQNKKKDSGSCGNICCLDCQILLYLESFSFRCFVFVSILCP